MAAKSHADEQLLEAVKVYVEHHGNLTHASRAMPNGGVSRSTLQSRLLEARRRKIGEELLSKLDEAKYVVKGVSTLRDSGGALKEEWVKTKLSGRDSDTVEFIPDPKKIVKISTLYDQQGKVAMQWIGEKPEDHTREALWRAFAEELSADVKRIKPTPKSKGKKDDDLLVVYPVGDHHTGMLAWAAETGDENYDLEESERLLSEASQRLINSAPASKHALIPFLGDFFHYDSYAPVTPAHKNLLDADSRYPKMIRAGVRMMRNMISAALEKHDAVHVIVSPGNHDPSTTAMVTILLSCLYEKEPRVRIDNSPTRHHYFEIGKVLLGVHHGDKAKLDKLPAIMAHDRAEERGRTEHRLWLTGHRHSEEKREYPGCKVEVFEVLAPPDAYAAHAGYRSQRGMKAIVFHKDHGEVERHTVRPSMLARES